MSLSTALSIAQSALRNTSRQTSIVSRNVVGCLQPRLHPAHRGGHQHGARRALGRHPARRQRAAVRQNNLGALSSLERPEHALRRHGAARPCGQRRRQRLLGGDRDRQAAAGAAALFGLAVQPQPCRERRRRGAPGRAHAERAAPRRSRPSAPTCDSRDRLRRSASSTICSPSSRTPTTPSSPARATAATFPMRSTSATRC